MCSFVLLLKAVENKSKGKHTETRRKIRLIIHAFILLELRMKLEKYED